VTGPGHPAPCVTATTTFASESNPVHADGWDVTGWAAVPGRAAGFTPGSADIPKVVAVLAELGTIAAPNVPGLWSIAEHWGRDTDDPRMSPPSLPSWVALYLLARAGGRP
jgi:hypothetical protein